MEFLSHETAQILGEVLLLLFVLFGKDAISYLFGQRQKNQEMKVMCEKVNDLHEWHSKEDSEGVKVWYNRKSLETSINHLSRSIERQNKILTDLASFLRETSKAVERIEQNQHQGQ